MFYFWRVRFANPIIFIIKSYLVYATGRESAEDRPEGKQRELLPVQGNEEAQDIVIGPQLRAQEDGGGFCRREGPSAHAAQLREKSDEPGCQGAEGENCGGELALDQEGRRNQEGGP